MIGKEQAASSLPMGDNSRAIRMSLDADRRLRFDPVTAGSALGKILYPAWPEGFSGESK